MMALGRALLNMLLTKGFTCIRTRGDFEHMLY